MRSEVELTVSIRTLVSDVVDLDDESQYDDLIASGRLDSLRLIELIVVIEQELGVSISLDTLDIESFRSVDSIAQLVNQLIGDAPDVAEPALHD